MKKFPAVLLAASICAASIFSGCSTSSSSSSSSTSSKADKSVTIRMTYWNNEDTVKTLLDYLEKTVPEAKIDYQFIENSQYDSILDTQLAAGEGPDIILESPASARKHAKVGYTEDLSSYKDKYSEAGTSAYTYEDKLYALPGISWFEGIYYNVDMFKNNNIALPTTFDEFISVCNKFNTLGITPLAAGLKDYQPMMKNSLGFITADYLSTSNGKSFGSSLADGNAKFSGTWNTYLTKWSDMIKNGVYTKDMLGIDPDQALDSFATGKAAMFESGPWDLDTIKSKNADLNIDMMPFYGTTTSDGWLIGGPGCGFAVNAKSSNKDTAYKLLDALSTADGQKAFWQDNQGGSSYLTGTSFDMPDEFNGVSKALTDGNVYCPWNEWGDASTVYQDYGKELQTYLMGSESLDDVLTNTDTKVTELLSK